MKMRSILLKAKQADFQVKSSRGQPAAKHHQASFIHLAATQLVGITPSIQIKRYHFQTQPCRLRKVCSSLLKTNSDLVGGTLGERHCAHRQGQAEGVNWLVNTHVVAKGSNSGHGAVMEMHLSPTTPYLKSSSRGADQHFF